MSERTRRVDHLLQEEISAIVQRELEDPRVGFVTITGVSTTPDLRHATVYASVIGDEAERKATMAALGRAMPFIRHRLGDLRLKRIPELHLREDDSVERGTRVMQLIEQVEAELAGDGPITEPAVAPEPLPSPTTLHEAGPTADGDEPLPPGYRRRVDRVSLRNARQRRGR